MAVGAEVYLGNGKLITPPEGWVREGFAVDNPLWILPKSRVRWYPPGAQEVALHWSLSTSPLDADKMEALQDVMRRKVGDVPLEVVYPLHPSVIRLPIAHILRARLLKFDRSGAQLCIEYGSEEFNEAGFICYSPTEAADLGEFQVLGYEGKQPAFDKFLDDAVQAIQSFAVNQPQREQGSESNDGAYILEEGETIRMVAAKKWPELSEEDLAVRTREIYAYNLSRGNVLKAWELKPGTKVFIP